MPDIFQAKVVHDQSADEDHGIPVSTPKDEKVNYGRCSETENSVWKKKIEGCRTVFVKTAATIKGNKVDGPTGHKIDCRRIINPEVTKLEPAIVYVQCKC